ncbi:glycoside hydrolase family 13 protein [Pelomonas sp. SE-A7]|uniref:glycoside hydrolase family 13 protein n=1 Tax=Pelomonas sp. SE-A7 TaxID=3054953 RepID=UPI00259C9F71|nr:glycoside hydrolase family 13 protein [Pelomonas sp. SE-A7]MDM4764668.1 glycoside hydrolase family 13 protein [Pelomonas sp. SE-A7]
MNRISKLGALLALGSSLMSQAQTLDRIEPAFWWTGMKSPALQLMVHGERIAELQPQLQAAAGVTLKKSTRVANPNYLFLDLEIAANARPGEFQIQFGSGDKAIRHSYRLLAREPGSAERQGFGPRDAIYLVVPDRFAQGVTNRPLPTGLLEVNDRRNPGGRHGGDLAGLRQHLDYIAKLGFTQIWPTPLTENNGAKYSYHGYAASDFYKIDARFGTNEEFRDLAREARGKGLGLVQDIVLNHIGGSHWWMRDMPTPDWVNQWPEYTETHHARVTLQDRYAADSDRKRFTDGWFSRNMPDLNQRNPFVATYLTQMSIWWVEYAGLSGIRTDTYSYSDREFLGRWSERLMQEYPRLNIVGEEWTPHPAIVSYWQRGKRNHDGYVSSTPSMMDFPLHEALLKALTEGDGHDSGLMRLYEALAHDFVYPAPEQLVLFEGNHDTPRLFSALKEDLGAWKSALAYIATARRIPQITYGTELLMQSPKHRDDGLVRSDFPGGWAGDAVDGFNGRGLTTRQAEAQAYVRQLFNWRKGQRAIHEGALMHYAPVAGVYALFRYLPDDPKASRILLLLNKGNAAATVDLNRFLEMWPGTVSVSDALSGLALKAEGGKLVVPARSPLIAEMRR